MRVKDDDVWRWAKERGKGFFIEPDQPVLSAIARVSKKAEENKNYHRYAKNKFMNSTDHFLIAHAFAHSFCVVTNEIGKSNSKKIIKIPDICDKMGVGFLKIHEVLRRENACFVLKKTGR